VQHNYILNQECPTLGSIRFFCGLWPHFYVTYLL